MAYSDCIVPIPVSTCSLSLGQRTVTEDRGAGEGKGEKERKEEGEREREAVEGEKRGKLAFCRTTTGFIHEPVPRRNRDERTSHRMPTNGRECGSKGLIARIT
ncbi:hypothetical protein WN48_07573 [Eufriesea mexicana]|uniref:Uncharacterized protein n=1 Tax=Eufriesea mexicana TaxID=516756 RepID=A0A310SJL7_9HYME|nr:hypothetical protein WN48_07573 [Eufriesea mexicana]